MSQDPKNKSKSGSANEIDAVIAAPKDTLKPFVAAADEKTVVEKPKPHELVLVVEDSKTNSAIIALNLRTLGFDVIEYKDGLAAKEGIEAMPPEQIKRIHAVFSDLMMPGMSGLELLTFIRQRPELGRLPFVICTALTDRKTVQQAQAQMANGIIVKPMTFGKIRQCVVGLFPKMSFPTEEYLASQRGRKSG